MPTRAAEILTVPIPPQGLSAAQYREIEQALKDWEGEVRAAIARYPKRSYDLGVEQTLAFLRMLGQIGQADLPPSGAVGPSSRMAVEWLKRYTLHEVDGALSKYIDQIRSALLYGLQGNVNPTQVASWLYKATRDAQVNWRTIARTEVMRANAAGRLDSIAAMGYDQVWCPKHTGACKQCRRLLEGKVFDLDQVRNATNFGRQVKDWIACIPLHPHCRHVWLPYLPDVFDEAQREYDALAENGLDDKTLDEMFDSSGQLKPQYENDPRLLAFFEETGKTVDPLEFVLGSAITKTRREEPPNLHHTTSRTRNCHMCQHVNRETGLCERYNWQVERDEVCDTFDAREVGKGFFDNPQAGLDPLLWTREERLRADVRDTIVRWWRHVFTADAPLWSQLFITGSAASRAWAGKRTAGDVDLQIVVDYDQLRAHHPEYARLSDPELHAALVTQVRSNLDGVEVAPGLGLDAFIRPEISRAGFAATISHSGQGVWDVARGEWVQDPPNVLRAEDVESGRILEGEGATLALEHPEWHQQADALRAEIQGILDRGDLNTSALTDLRRVYEFVHDLRAREFAQGRGEQGLGNFLWRYLMDLGPLARVKHLLHATELGKVWPLYRWSDPSDTVAKAAAAKPAATDAGVEHWITVHPHGPGTDGQPVLVRNSQDGKHMVVIGGAGGHLNYLRIDRSRQIKPTDGSKQPEQGPINEPSDESFENKSPEQLAAEEHEAQQKMEQAREQLAQLRLGRQQVNERLHDYVKGLVDQVGQTASGEHLGWDDLDPEEQKRLFARLKASALHVAAAGPLNKKDVNESGLTIKRDKDTPEEPEKATLESALKDEQSDELAETPEADTETQTEAPEEQAKKRMPLIALSTDQADDINRMLAEAAILGKKARTARKVAAGNARGSDAMSLDYSADDVTSAVKNRIAGEQRSRVARDILDTAESNNSKKLIDRAVKQGGYDTLDTFAQAVLGDSQIKPEVARLLGVGGTAQLIAHKLYSEAKAGRLDIDKAYDSLSTLVDEREKEVASRARARALRATEQVKEAVEAAKHSGESTDALGLWTKTAANSVRTRKLVEAATTLGMAISGLEAASALKVALQRAVGPSGVKTGAKGTKLRLARGGIDQIRIGGFAGAYPIKQLAAKAGVDVSDRDIRRLGEGNFELTVDPRKLEHLFQPRQDPHKELRDRLQSIRTAADEDKLVQEQRTTPGMTDVLSPAQARGKTFLLAAEHGLLAFEPGVGKTHTAIAAAMQKMHAEPGKHRALIIAPKSVAREWRDTVMRQGGTHSVQVLGAKFEGEDENPGKHQQKGADWRKQVQTPADFNVVSYETLRAHPEIAEKLGATIHIADEIQKAKNESSGIFQGLTKAGHAPGVAHRWALTGTPIEKHTGDIHSMLSWANPEGLEDQRTFREKFDKTAQYEHLTAEDRIRQFREGISERMFHLAAQDAGGDLPTRNEGNGGNMHIVPVELSQAHKELLRQKVSEVNETNADLRRRRAEGEVDSKGRLIRPSLPFGGRDVIMRNLHKPDGISVEDHAIAQKVADIVDQNPGFDYDGKQTDGQHAGHYDGKTVVFAEQVGHLAIVRKALEARGVKVFEGHASESTDGSGKKLSDADNSNNIRDFLAHGGKAVFLSSDKNNAGINLQLGLAKGRFQHGATRLVHLTLPMNNARIAQREARIHRRGSVAPVDTYHVTANTPFEKLDRDRLAEERRRMDLVGNREDKVRTIEGGQTATLRQRYTEQGGRLANEQEEEAA